MKQFVILFVWTIWWALFASCTHEIHENGEANVTYNAIQDVDGNYYDAVQIGKQVWMRTNLRTRHFRDGGEIKFFNNNSNIYHYTVNVGEPVCYNPYFNFSGDYLFGDRDQVINAYNYFQKNERSYGLLYNWYAVDDERGLCPEGWHVPNNADWHQFMGYVEREWCYNDYSVAKALASQYGWSRSMWNDGAPGCNPEENNASGFGAIPAGSGYIPLPIDDMIPYIGGVGFGTSFWSATQYDSCNAYNRSLSYSNASVSCIPQSKSYGYSVRCIRD